MRAKKSKKKRISSSLESHWSKEEFKKKKKRRRRSLSVLVSSTRKSELSWNSFSLSLHDYPRPTNTCRFFLDVWRIQISTVIANQKWPSTSSSSSRRSGGKLIRHPRRVTPNFRVPRHPTHQAGVAAARRHPPHQPLF